MDRSSKEELVKTYKDIFESSSIGILVETKGLTVAEVTEIRKSLSGSGNGVRVLKNRIAKIAAKETDFSIISEDFKEVRTFIYGNSDPIELAKTVVKFSKDIESLNLCSAAMKSGNQFIYLSTDEVVQLSKLPSKEELIAKLLFVMNAPITNFARTLNEIPTSFARVVQAIGESKNN